MTTMNPNDLFPQMNDDVMRGIDQYVEVQSRFIEAWQESLERSTDDELITSGAEGVADAYRVWLDASREWTEQFLAASEGEELDPREVRDVWLKAANESAQSLMTTAAFSRLTGQGVVDSLELQHQQDEAVQAMMEHFGVATSHNVEEVGERLVELERRQHAVEQKLDRLLETLEDA